MQHRGDESVSRMRNLERGLIHAAVADITRGAVHMLLQRGIGALHLLVALHNMLSQLGNCRLIRLKCLREE